MLTLLPCRKPASAPQQLNRRRFFYQTAGLSYWRSRVELVVHAMNSMTYHFVSVFSGGEVGSISGSEVNQMQSRSAFVQLSASTYKQFGRPCRDIFSPGYEGEACHRMRLRRAPKVSHHGNGYWPLDGSPKRSGSNRLPRVRETHMTALASGVDWPKSLRPSEARLQSLQYWGFWGR